MQFIYDNNSCIPSRIYSLESLAYEGMNKLETRERVKKNNKLYK